MRLRAFFATFLTCLSGVFAFNARYATKAPPLDLMTRIAAEQQSEEIVVSDTTLYQRGWIRARLATPRPSCPDVLLLGSSTFGTFEADMFGGRTILNAWLGNASVQDMESFTAVLHATSCRPKAIMLGTDLWWTGNGAWNFGGWQELANDYTSYRSSQGRFTAHIPLRIRWDEFKENLSFQRTLDTMRAGRMRGFSNDPRQRAGLRLIPGTPDEVCGAVEPHEINLRSFDGHYTKCPQLEASPDGIRQIARSYLPRNTHNMAEWHEVADDRLVRLATIITSWRAMGIAVVMLAMPYHPLTWEQLMAEPHLARNMHELDTRLARIALDAQVGFLWFRDASTVPCVDADFEDSHHPRSSCTRRIAAKVLEALVGDAD